MRFSDDVKPRPREPSVVTSIIGIITTVIYSVWKWYIVDAFFETRISFSGARNISVHALAATSSGN